MQQVNLVAVQGPGFYGMSIMTTTAGPWEVYNALVGMYGNDEVSMMKISDTGASCMITHQFTEHRDSGINLWMRPCGFEQDDPFYIFDSGYAQYEHESLTALSQALRSK